MTALSDCTFLRGSYRDAAVQLFYKMPGRYQLVRRAHHSNIIEGTNLIHANLICPSFGTSEIILRGAMDGEYEVELIQTTVINLRSSNGHSATKTEKRAFRIENRRWSIWTVDDHSGSDIVGRKVAEITFEGFTLPTNVGVTAADVVQNATLAGGPWHDRHGANAMTIRFWVNVQLVWRELHQVNLAGLPGFHEDCRDELWPETFWS